MECGVVNLFLFRFVMWSCIVVRRGGGGGGDTRRVGASEVQRGLCFLTVRLHLRVERKRGGYVGIAMVRSTTEDLVQV